MDRRRALDDDDEDLSPSNKMPRFRDVYVSLTRTDMISMETVLSGQFDNADTSDVTVTINDRVVFHLHHLVLSAASEMFAVSLSKTWQDSSTLNRLNDSKLVLNLTEEKEHLMKSFLRGLYTGQLVVTDENIYDLYLLADKYIVKTYIKGCKKYIMDNTKYQMDSNEIQAREYFSVQTVCKLCTINSDSQIADQAYCHLLARFIMNSSAQQKFDGMSEISLPLFLKLVNDDNLTLGEEDIVYAVFNYISAKAITSKDYLLQLMHSIRYPLLRKTSLLTLEKNGLNLFPETEFKEILYNLMKYYLTNEDMFTADQRRKRQLMD